MGELTWTDEALRWLEDIFEYIAADNPEAAIRTVQGIFERAQVLKRFPEIGHRYLASSRDVRILLYGHYRIAYLLKPDGGIDILGVFHGALDIDRFQLPPRITRGSKSGCSLLAPGRQYPPEDLYRRERMRRKRVPSYRCARVATISSNSSRNRPETTGAAP